MPVLQNVQIDSQKDSAVSMQLGTVQYLQHLLLHTYAQQKGDGHMHALKVTQSLLSENSPQYCRYVFV